MMNNREHPLIAAIKRTLADPGATRRMVLEQGKAFVYLSDDDQFIVTEWPDGRIEKKPFQPMNAKGAEGRTLLLAFHSRSDLLKGSLSNDCDDRSI